MTNYGQIKYKEDLMVKVESKFNDNVVKELFKRSLKKMIFVFILSVIIIILGAINFIEENTSLGAFLIIFGIIYIPILVILVKYSLKKTQKTMHVLSNDTISTYVFTEEEISINTTKNDEYQSEVRAKYSFIYRIVETKDSYLLYISYKQAHVFFKSEIVEGNVSELNHIFRMNLGKKFKSISK